MMNTKYIVVIMLCSSTLNAMNEVVYKKPYVVAQVYNESENIIFMSGHNENQVLHADTLNPESKIIFWVRDEQPIKISARGIYCIYLNFYYDNTGYPQDTRLIFEKLEAAQVSNKIGPTSVFRKLLPVCPFGKRVTFRILLDETVVMISDTQVLPDDTPLSAPEFPARPPFAS